MKLSAYNLFLSSGQEEYILHNTLSGSVSIINNAMKDLIEHGDETDIDTGVMEVLSKLGVYVDGNLDEKNLIVFKRDQFKYKTTGLSVVLVPTYVCNLGCAYCQVDKSPWSTMDERTKERVIKGIKKLITRYNYKALEMNIYGGEPFVAFQVWIDIVDQLHEFCLHKGVKFRIGIYTNGTILKDTQIEQLLRYNIKGIQVSVDGPRAIHDKRRPYRKTGKGSYDTVIDTIARLQQADLHPIVAINIDKENYDSIEELFADLKAHGLAKLPMVFGAISTKTDACSSYQSCYTTAEVVRLIPKVWNLAKKQGFQLNFAPLSFPIYCGYQTFSNLVIDAAGDIYKCYAFVGLKEHRCATIADDGELHYEAPYYAWMTRDPLQMESCRECKLLPFCGGGCGAQAFWDHGTYQAPACQYISNLLTRQLKAYVEDAAIVASYQQANAALKVVRQTSGTEALDIHPCGCEKRQPQPIQYEF